MVTASAPSDLVRLRPSLSAWIVYGAQFLLFGFLAFAFLHLKKDILGWLTLFAFLFLVLWCVKALTTAVKLQDDAIAYSSFFIFQKSLRLSEIEAIIMYSMPIFAQGFAFRKIFYAIVPIGRKYSVINVDAGLFSKKQLEALDAFFNERKKLVQRVSRMDAMKMLKEFRQKRKS